MDKEALKLTTYVQSLTDFKLSQTNDSYTHMGAVVVDGILQAGLNYTTVVLPRVNAVITKYPAADTTSKFMKVCVDQGIKEILNWKSDVKPNYIMKLLRFLKDNNIETTSQLHDWLEIENIKHYL